MTSIASIPRIEREPLGDSRARIACTHCGLDVPAGLIQSIASAQFCCAGCRAAYDIIHSCGLDRYYRLRDETATSDPGPVKSTGRRYAEFDDPVFQSLYVRTLPLSEGVGREESSLSTPSQREGAGGRVFFTEHHTSHNSANSSASSSIALSPFLIPHPIRSTELMLSGVHCAACVWLVEKLATVVPGVLESRLDLRRSLVHLTWDSGQVSLSRIAQTLDSLGYPPHPARGVAARDARRIEDRKHMVRLGVAGACAANVMLAALALYAGAFDGMEPAYLHLFRWVSLGISTVSLLWPGWVFFRSAWASIRTRSLHLDLPIAIGLAAGGIWGAVNTIRGVGEIYFDSLAVLVFVLLVGRFIQHRQQRWAADSVELLFSLTPSSARRVCSSPTDETRTPPPRGRGQGGGFSSPSIPDDSVEGCFFLSSPIPNSQLPTPTLPPSTTEDVPIEALSPGDLVEVLAGDSIPVDGVIESGVSDLDESLLSGESRPVRVIAGNRASAGAVNLTAPLRIRVEATGESTRVGRLMKLVSDASQRRAPIVRLADKLAGWFVVGSLSFSLITLTVWLYLDPSRAIDNAAALLIVTCPCAVGLATPLAMTVAIGRAARRGILIKGGEALERLAKPGRMFLDKTGTLTHGRLSASHWIGDESLKPLVAALERRSTHPIAAALARLSPPDESIIVEHVEQIIGKGITGVVNGRHLTVGSLPFVQEQERNHPLPEGGGRGEGSLRAHASRHLYSLAALDALVPYPSMPSSLFALLQSVPVAHNDSVFSKTLASSASQTTRHGGILSSGHLNAPDHVPGDAERQSIFIARCAARLLSPVFIAVDGEIAAAVGVGDSLRASTPAAIDTMQREGWRLELLSGDHQAVVSAAGAELQLAADTCHGGASPEDKLARVQTAVSVAGNAPIVMVGDGVNDAAALSAASVGIAVHGGAEASLAAADIYLNTPGLESIASLTHAARATMRTIRAALVASIFYNSIAAALAMTGYLNPIIAAILMPVSSITVLTLALRSNTFATKVSSPPNETRRLAPCR